MTESVMDKILERLVEGRSLRSICRDEDIPVTSSAVRMWVVRNPDSLLSAQYARARQLGMDELAEEIFDISDDSSNDYMMRENKRGDKVPMVDHENISRSKLRVDSRKWYLSKLAPKRYGDKVQTDVTNSDSSFSALAGMSQDQINHKVALILKNAEHKRLEAMKAEAQNAETIEDEEPTRDELL